MLLILNLQVLSVIRVIGVLHKWAWSVVRRSANLTVVALRVLLGRVWLELGRHHVYVVTLWVIIVGRGATSIDLSCVATLVAITALLKSVVWCWVMVSIGRHILMLRLSYWLSSVLHWVTILLLSLVLAIVLEDLITWLIVSERALLTLVLLTITLTIGTR